MFSGRGEGLANAEYDLWEYLLVAYPDEVVRQKITEEKRSFQQRHKHEPAAGLPPHITVANFLAKEGMEDTLVRWIQNVCRLHTGFPVTLHNYSGFPPHTVFLRVQDPAPFLRLAGSLKIIDGFIQSNDCPPLYLVSRPHLTIASGLSAYTYENAIRDYTQKSFFESFSVDRLVLLKRDVHRKCQLVNTFILPPPLPE